MLKYTKEMEEVLTAGKYFWHKIVGARNASGERDISKNTKTPCIQSWEGILFLFVYFKSKINQSFFIIVVTTKLNVATLVQVLFICSSTWSSRKCEDRKYWRKAFDNLIQRQVLFSTGRSRTSLNIEFCIIIRFIRCTIIMAAPVTHPFLSFL